MIFKLKFVGLQANCSKDSILMSHLESIEFIAIDCYDLKGNQKIICSCSKCKTSFQVN